MSRRQNPLLVAALACCLLATILSSKTCAREDDYENVCKQLVVAKKWGELASTCKEWSERKPKYVIPLKVLGIAYWNLELYPQYYDAINKKRNLEITLQPQYSQQDVKSWDLWIKRLKERQLDTYHIWLFWVIDFVEENPRSPVAHLLIGSEYIEDHDFAKAIEHLRKAIQLDPNYADAYSHLAVALTEAGQVDEGISCARKALEIHPKWAPAWCNLGNAYEQEGALEQMISAYKTAIKCRPDFALAYKNLGKALYQHKKEYQEAENALEKSVELNPTYCESWYNLGYLYLNKPRPENGKAVACLEKSIDCEPTFPDAYIELGIAYKRKGMFSKAIDCYKKNLVLKPGNAKAYFNLGVSYYRLGLRTEAEEAFKKASEVDPDGQMGLLSRQWLSQIK